MPLNKEKMREYMKGYMRKRRVKPLNPVKPTYRVTVSPHAPVSNRIGAIKPCPRCQAPAGHISGFCHLP